MAALLSSPAGPPMRFDMLEHPSSPTRRHDDLPADFDRSFGSSMSLGSSFDLGGGGSSAPSSSSPRNEHQGSTPLDSMRPAPFPQIQDSNQAGSLMPPSPSLSSTSSISLSSCSSGSSTGPALTAPKVSSRRSSPTTNRTLGAAMGTQLNGRSPGLAAKLSSPHYMDISPAVKRTVPAPSSIEGRLLQRESDGYPLEQGTPSHAFFTDHMLPPGSAMKEDTPVGHTRTRSARRGSSRQNSPDMGGTGATLGRLFGTNMSLNAPEGNPDDSFEASLDPDASFEKEQPPAKRRPASLPLGEPRPPIRPGLRSAGAPLANSSRKVPLMSTFRQEPQHRSSSESLRRLHRSSEPSLQQQQRSRKPSSRSRSRHGSVESQLGEESSVTSFADHVRDRQEAYGLGASVATHATIIESPSPSTFERQDLGSYFFDPQSPEAPQTAVAGPSSLARPGPLPRPFLKSHTAGIVPTIHAAQEQQVQARTLLGKRANPYNRRPPLVPQAHRDHKSAQAVLGSGHDMESMLQAGPCRPTAPAPRRCHSTFDAGCLTGGMSDSGSNDSITMLGGPSIPGRIFPDGFDANGSPIARSRPSLLRRPSKDDSSPLAYGTRKQMNRNEAGLAVDSTPSHIGSSPFGSEGMPGFGASERAGKILPCFSVKEDGLMRITPETLVALMQGQYNDRIGSYQVVDCRFGYEHEGGHIPGAINLSTLDQVKSHFLLTSHGRELPPRSQSGKPDEFGNSRKPVLVFHCEFSCKRAPSMALALRQADRALAADYPNCHYPELYVLQGGYCAFFKRFQSICEPAAYVEMDDPAYQNQRSAELNGFRKQFARHRSFAYGDSKKTEAEVRGGARGVRNTLGCAPTGFLRDVKPAMICEEESSFETDSPSNLPAAKRGEQLALQQRHRKASVRGGHLLKPGSEGFAGEERQDGEEPSMPPSDSMGDTSVDSSFDELGGVTESPCAAAGNRKMAYLGPRGGQLGALGPRAPFQRAGTTGNLFQKR